MATALERLESELLDLARSQRRTWEQMARLLLEVEQRKLWQAAAGSFTGWLHGVAKRADLQPSTLWRAMKAGRIYLQLTGEEDPQAIDDVGVAAEALELADKISRHAPAKVQRKVIQRTLDGEETVASLRELWSTYRPAAGGVTARGRLPDDEEERNEAVALRASRWEAEKRRPEVKEALLAGQIVAALGETDWVGPHDAAHVEAGVELNDGRLDAVVAVRRDVRYPEQLELHVVEVKGSRKDLASPMRCARRGALAHKVWLAVGQSEVEQARKVLSPHMGLLSLGGSRLKVLREAKLQRPKAEATQKLMAALIARAYQWT